MGNESSHVPLIQPVMLSLLKSLPRFAPRFLLSLSLQGSGFGSLPPHRSAVIYAWRISCTNKLSYYLISDRFPSLLQCHFLSDLSHCLAFNSNSAQHSSSLSSQHIPTPSILIKCNTIILFFTQPQHLF